MPYMGHLVYVPLVTLHNPYNASISFDRLQVVVRNIPMAFRFIVNDQPQNRVLSPFGELFINKVAYGSGNSNNQDQGEKSFALDIANWSGTDASAVPTTPIVLKPGQTLLSSPYLNPDATFNARAQFDFDDWRNDQTGVDKYGTVTTMIKAKPGFRGKAVGYDIDWLTPWDSLDPNLIYSNDTGIGQLGLKPEDDVKIETAVRQPNLGMRDRLRISASITFGTYLELPTGPMLTIAVFWPKSLTIGLQNPAGVPILPMSLVNGGSATNPAGNSQNIDNDKANEWNGYRELSDAQMEGLAKEIVSQVKARGPFLSLSEFVNRRIGSNPELTRNGALQAALDKAKTNDGMFSSQVPVAAADICNEVIYRYKTPENAVGNPAQGAPGWITQGDLMRVIEPLATVRTDTFVIRTYGDATDANGKITARAYAEAVVQRVPEYLNPADRPSLNVYLNDDAHATNKTFGRRIRSVSFRWLANPEV